MSGSRTLLFVGLLLLALAEPVTAVTADYDTLLRDALAARDRGDFAAAEAALRDAFAIARDKREATWLLALVLAYQGRHGEAEQMLGEALAAAPDDLELRLTLARVKLYQGLPAEAAAIVAPLAREHPGVAEVAELRLQVDRAMSAAAAGEGYAHAVSGSFETSRLNRPWFSDWYERVVEYRHRSGDGDQQYLRIHHAHRFGLHDTMVEAGWLIGERGRWPVELSLGATGGNDFLPEHRVRVATRTHLRPGADDATLVHVALQQSRYLTGSTRAIWLHLEQYLAGGRAWVMPGVGVLEDEGGERRRMWQIGIHGQPGPRLRAGITWTDAPETEDNVTTDSRTVHGYLAWQASRRTLLRLDLARNLRRDSYTRESVAAGVQYRF